MDIGQFNSLMAEERIGGQRASWTNREIKNTLKSLCQMDMYKDLPNGKLLDVFMKKFDRYIKQNNLNRSNVKNIAAIELKKQRARK